MRVFLFILLALMVGCLEAGDDDSADDYYDEDDDAESADLEDCIEGCDQAEDLCYRNAQTVEENNSCEFGRMDCRQDCGELYE